MYLSSVCTFWSSIYARALYLHPCNLRYHQAEYCPPLDPALVSAILSDYDLNNDHAIHQARITLDSLKDTAVAEESTGFDPSGSSSLADGSPECSNCNRSASPQTDMTNLSVALSSTEFSDDQSHSALEDLEGIESLDNESKVRLISDVFPSLSEFTVTHTLRKHQYRWSQTFDDLLNQVYIHENGHVDNFHAKGIDAFSDENTTHRGRKGKKKKTLPLHLAERRSTSLPGTIDNAPPRTNKWQAASEDVNFIAERVNLPAKTVSSIYNHENASVQRTIVNILESYLGKHQTLLSDDPIIQVQAHELGQDFPTVSDQYRLAIIGITRQSDIVARELTQALVAKGASEDAHAHHVVPQYAPLRISEDDGSFAAPVKARDSALCSLDFVAASTKASTLAAARSVAMGQARAAYRKSKSNHLMGGAAAYYSEISRDMRTSSQQYTEAAADALVASQSDPSYIDLHGVTADDAVRITSIKVNQWWDRLGENRYNGRLGADDRSQGFRIVTGAGRHSKGGRGVLGPAVQKLLTRDGWKFESMTGEIIVRGKVRA